MSPFSRVPLRRRFCDILRSLLFTLLFVIFRSDTAGENLLFREAAGIFPPAASGDRGALSGRCRLKDARRGAASAGSVRTAMLQSPQMRVCPRG